MSKFDKYIEILEKNKELKKIKDESIKNTKNLDIFEYKQKKMIKSFIMLFSFLLFTMFICSQLGEILTSLNYFNINEAFIITKDTNLLSIIFKHINQINFFDKIHSFIIPALIYYCSFIFISFYFDHSMLDNKLTFFHNAKNETKYYALPIIKSILIAGLLSGILLSNYILFILLFLIMLFNCVFISVNLTELFENKTNIKNCNKIIKSIETKNINMDSIKKDISNLEREIKELKNEILNSKKEMTYIAEKASQITDNSDSKKEIEKGVAKNIMNTFNKVNESKQIFVAYTNQIDKVFGNNHSKIINE